MRLLMRITNNLLLNLVVSFFFCNFARKSIGSTYPATDDMRRIITIALIFFIAIQSIASNPTANDRRRKRQVKPDSIALVSNQDISSAARHRMSCSARPVQLQVVGRTVKVQSPESQVLPIYNSAGAFYLVMRLNKGTNWLNGLPKGKYYINNRAITIN